MGCQNRAGREVQPANRSAHQQEALPLRGVREFRGLARLVPYRSRGDDAFGKGGSANTAGNESVYAFLVCKKPRGP